jgi:SAM-dependent methyltransferase
MRRLDWDYTTLADAYVHRPDYSPVALDAALARAGTAKGAAVADMGAGAAHLAIELARRGFDVQAVEPNANMRAHGVARTKDMRVKWHDAVMEDAPIAARSVALVTYGSSFGVADRDATLKEAARVLGDGGHVLCVFNHRDLDDPLQAEIEAYIRSEQPAFDHGPRRKDQGPAIDATGLFGAVERFEARIVHRVEPAKWVEAWASHATLARQTGARFPEIVAGIGRIVAKRGAAPFDVPYFTRAWLAPLVRR